ncbi:MAG: PP2C family serine/threonine-protein phosphatase [Afipia sp.]
MSLAWHWAGACSIGSSHIKTGLECQDRASCIALTVDGTQYLSIVVSDGAGSAKEAARGATLVCSGFQRFLLRHIRTHRIEAITEEIVADWLDDIRERINVTSATAGLSPRDYAATLVAAVVGPDHAAVVHVGDGATVLRDKNSGEWCVPSWPFHGEWANTTRFIVDDPQPTVDLVHVQGTYDRVAVFSDGLEYLVLDHRNRTAPAPFFERLIRPLTEAQHPGRDRRLSKHLRAYLDSETVCEATDDDKSLILGALV